MSHRVRIASTALVMLLGFTPGASAAATAEGCDSDPRRRQLDFWVGEWRAVGEDGRPGGTHHVQKGERGCVIEERWEAPSGGTGRSLSYFDPSVGKWRQSRVDDRGRVARYEGELRGGAMHLLGTLVEADGSTRRARVVLTPRPGPAVHQRLELAGQGETTWSLHSAATYVPVDQLAPVAVESGAVASPPSETAIEEASGEAQPANAAAEAPAALDAAAGQIERAPEPAEESVPTPPPTAPAVGHGSVRPQTGMLTSEALARTDARIPMASPMVLRFPVGRIDRLSPGYAWTTKEVARYECEGTTVESVRMTKGRPKAGRERVEVTALLASSRRTAHVELGVVLLAGDERVAEATLSEAPVGMGLPAQIQQGAVEHTLVLQLEKGRLAELFAGGERPELELTLRPLRKGR